MTDCLCCFGNVWAGWSHTSHQGHWAQDMGARSFALRHQVLDQALRAGLRTRTHIAEFNSNLLSRRHSRERSCEVSHTGAGVISGSEVGAQR